MLTNGVVFSSPEATSAIIPSLLNQVWEEHQPQGKMPVLWELRQQGGVSGDSFVKVAFEPEYDDPAGNPHQARIRILPLNSAFVFPEYHPHDYTRLLRLKLKYRFWGTALEGTRQVFTYTELWTEDAMQSYVNDELIDSVDNPLGVIPFIHIANRKVPSSPWGLSDIQDVTDLNRQFNETATYITDIINYYASPMTVIIGAKANNLERGAKKVWAIPNKDASVQNLSLGAELTGPIAFLELLKEKMHELVGIPTNALGTELSISNTSGVALQIALLPLMQKFFQLKIQYESGLMRVNELIIRVAALYMPELLEFDPTRSAPLEDGQLFVLDRRDPLTYRNTAAFASPLPLDKLIALNEIQMEMGLGLESKTGALRKLGEPNPQDKLNELLNELHNDALEQAALDLLKAQLLNTIEFLTGRPMDGGGSSVPPGPDGGGGQQVPSAGGPGVNSAPTSAAGGMKPPWLDNSPGSEGLFEQLTTLMAGTKIPQVRNPGKDD